MKQSGKCVAFLLCISTVFDPDMIEPGIWQIMPSYSGDHMSLQGGILKRNDIRPFYLELLELIETLPEN